MQVVIWSCPHCHQQADSQIGDAASIRRCSNCGYVHPAVQQGVAGCDGHVSFTSDATSDAELNRLPVDRYEVLGNLSQGSQGRLLRARHRHLDLPCVIKVSTDVDEEWSEVAATRLRSEAQAGSRVNHAHVARVLDCDRVVDRWYFVMEYVEGANLREVLEAVGPLPWPQVVEIGIQAAQGLAAIHSAQLIHRDIKPSNLMIDPAGKVKILDLGLVKIRHRTVDLAATRVGQMLGTPFYMPPEQFDGEDNLDSRADIYALGATLYHLVVGNPPFVGHGILDLSMRHRHDPVAWPEALKESVPQWFKHILETCLAKRPEHRFESATLLADALSERGAAKTSLGPTVLDHADRARRGLAVVRFRNISEKTEDDWIGDAIADYLSHRLTQLAGHHVVDRHTLERLLNQVEPDWLSRPGPARLAESARRVGAGTVIFGGVQRSGSQVLITSQAMTADGTDPWPLAHLQGEAADLFQLEEKLAASLLDHFGGRLARRPAGRGASPGNLEAHEQQVRGQRAFADGDYAAAIRHALEARRLDPEYMEPLSLSGACYARIGDYDRAVECHQLQERLARQSGDSTRLAEALANLGVMYYYKGEYGEAFEFLDQARTLAEKLDRPVDLAKYCGNLGFVLMRMDRLRAAEESFSLAIDVLRGLGDLVALSLPYNGMGTVLLKQQRYAESKEYYERALLLAEEVRDRVNTGVSHMNLGRCDALMKRYDEARSRFHAALTALDGTEFWNGLTLVYEHKAEMHLQLSEADAALECIDRRIDLARRHGNQRMEAAGWEQKARAFELLKETDQAVRCLKQSLEISQRPVPHQSLHRYLGEIARRTPFE